MASKQSTVDYLFEQVLCADRMRYRRMFGEYAIYLNEKVIGFVCDDQLFVKPTKAGKVYIGEVEEAPPYPGAKMYFYISSDHWEDRDWLTGLFLQTAEELPLPKRKKK
jgi:TfoX/Sxy family transcriptional regulator of competence genes